MRWDRMKAWMGFLTILMVAGLVVGALIAGTRGTMAQETLPPGPGMEQTMKACGNCHSVGTFAYLHRNGVTWETTINNMVGWGMTISDDEYNTILEYLTTYLGLTPPPATPAR